MPLLSWDTRGTAHAEFLEAWATTLSQATHAHFGFDLRYLKWEAEHGRHAIAAVVRDDGRQGAFILRREHGVLRSGLPWRWQMVLASPDRPEGVGLRSEDVDWLLQHVRTITGRQRFECFAPALASDAGARFPGGATIIRDLRMSDAQILASFDVNKRRAVKRAIREGFEVIEPADAESMHAFSRLQVETERRRGQKSIEVEDPAPGEAWREWELPWMWLLVAVRQGRIEGGSGYGVFPGGMVDYRANASTEPALKLGVNVLLAYEALRRGRDRGHRWMNWGGANAFKHELGGELVPLHRWIGGDWRWLARHRLSWTVQRARALMVRKARERADAPPGGAIPRTEATPIESPPAPAKPSRPRKSA